MLGIWCAVLWVPGIFFFQGSTWQVTLLELLLLAFLLALINRVVRPAFKTLTFFLYLITLGVFSFVTSALMFMLLGWVSQTLSLPLMVTGFWPALWGAVVTSVVSTFTVMVLSVFVPSARN